VSVTLSTDRQTYYLGERIRLTLRITNVSNETVKGHFAVRPGLGPTRLYYRTDGGGYAELRCFPTPPGRIGLKRRTIGVGEKLVNEIDLSVATLEPLALLLDRLGRYEFHVVVEDVPEDDNARLQSNSVSVDVVEAPPEEREAQGSYTPRLAYLAQIADGPDAFVTPESMAEAAAFIDRHRRSRYARPVKEGLLKWLKTRVQTRRASDIEASLYEKLMRASDTVPPDLHAEASPAMLWPPNHELAQPPPALVRSMRANLKRAFAVSAVAMRLRGGRTR
jgi:hypothetical protein